MQLRGVILAGRGDPTLHFFVDLPYTSCETSGIIAPLCWSCLLASAFSSFLGHCRHEVNSPHRYSSTWLCSDVQEQVTSSTFGDNDVPPTQAPSKSHWVTFEVAPGHGTSDSVFSESPERLPLHPDAELQVGIKSVKRDQVRWMGIPEGATKSHLGAVATNSSTGLCVPSVSLSTSLSCLSGSLGEVCKVCSPDKRCPSHRQGPAAGSPFLPCSSLECVSVFSVVSTHCSVVLLATLETTEVQQVA